MPFFLPTLVKGLPHYFSQYLGIAIASDFISLFTGPKLPMRLVNHAMVQLGNGLAMIGGYGNDKVQAKIHLLSCMNKNCSISTISQELSVPRYWFLAIPTPDTITRCISGGKKGPQKVSDFWPRVNEVCGLRNMYVVVVGGGEPKQIFLTLHNKHKYVSTCITVYT